MKKWVIAAGISAVIVVLIALGFVFRDQIVATLFAPTTSEVETVEGPEPAVIADGLTTPWSIAFLPSGDMLVSERGGTIARIGEDETRTQIEGVQETSEGGLLGVALDPEYEDNSQIYVYYTTVTEGELTNQVDRYELEGKQVSERTTILSGIPASGNHNGGAIAFGPDDMLYITTGDAEQEELAQDTGSLAGKILRINPDGSVPEDNPFENEVWSYGHRNPQGIAWDDSGQLWSVEHGPSGVETGRDELNRIMKGENYGWPVITGDETREDMRAPTIHSGTDDTWAPAGLGYHDGKLYFAGLRGQALYVYDITAAELTKQLSEEYGRLRAVTVEEGEVYISTSNRDGRGAPRADDDKILRLRGI